MNMQNNSGQPERGGRSWGLVLLLLIGAVFVIIMLLLRRPVTDSSPAVEALPRLGAVPAFALTDAGGTTITLDALKGKIWVADFIFTKCGGTCPMMTSTLYQVNQDLDPSLGVQLVSISVDPENDTPEVLKAYADNNSLPRERWYFLTGTRDAIHELAKNGFHLAVSDSGTTQRLITHSSKLAVVDRSGQIRAYYDGTDTLAAREVRTAIARLMLEPEGKDR